MERCKHKQDRPPNATAYCNPLKCPAIDCTFAFPGIEAITDILRRCVVAVSHSHYRLGAAACVGVFFQAGVSRATPESGHSLALLRTLLASQPSYAGLLVRCRLELSAVRGSLTSLIC